MALIIKEKWLKNHNKSLTNFSPGCSGIPKSLNRIIRKTSYSTAPQNLNTQNTNDPPTLRIMNLEQADLKGGANSSFPNWEALWMYCHGPIGAWIQGGGQDRARADGGRWSDLSIPGRMTWGAGWGSPRSLVPLMGCQRWREGTGRLSERGRREKGREEGKSMQWSRGETEVRRRTIASPTLKHGEEMGSMQGKLTTREEGAPPLITRLT